MRTTTQIMDRLESYKTESTVLQLWDELQSTVFQWADSAYSVSLARRVFAGDSDGDSPHEEDTIAKDGSSPATTSKPTASDEAVETTAAVAASNIADREVAHNAVVYRLLRRLRRFVETSWLYRWLTAEPEAETVVIDLRETLSAGPILAWIDDRIRSFIAVMPTAGSLRRGFRLRSRFVERPLRVISIGVLAVTLLTTVFVATSETELGGSTILLLTVLLLAARGTQSTHSLAELVETPWYEWVENGLAVFEPPAPPTEVPDNDDDPPEEASSKSISEHNIE